MLANHLKLEIEKLQKAAIPSQLIPVPKWNNHQNCMICSPTALLGLKINFFQAQDVVWARYQNNLHQQGFDNIAHGGFIAALLDGVMCQSLFAKNVEAVTADMTIRYLHEVPLQSAILLKGQVISSRNSLYKVEGELFVNQQLMAKSEARFMKKRQT